MVADKPTEKKGPSLAERKFRQDRDGGPYFLEHMEDGILMTYIYGSSCEYTLGGVRCIGVHIEKYDLNGDLLHKNGYLGSLPANLALETQHEMLKVKYPGVLIGEEESGWHEIKRGKVVLVRQDDESIGQVILH